MTEPMSVSGFRVSDADREQVAALLQRHHAVGRLTLAELDERVTAAYAARTRDQLDTLTTDLPTDPAIDPDPAMPGVDPGLLCLLWWLCPPAGLAHWLYARGARRRSLEGTLR
jgi:hypothetical protein